MLLFEKHMPIDLCRDITDDHYISNATLLQYNIYTVQINRGISCDTANRPL